MGILHVVDDESESVNQASITLLTNINLISVVLSFGVSL